MKDITTEEAVEIVKKMHSSVYLLGKQHDALGKVLNELDTLQNGFNTAVEHQTELIRENTNFRYQLFNNKKELEKKDKIIDAMAEVIEECRQNDCLESEDIDLSQIAGAKAIKQYFERKVENGGR